MGQDNGQKTAKGLTAAFVRSVKEPGKYGDQHGLMLRVTPSGSKQWIWRGTVGGRRVDLGLGGFPYTSLAEARQAAFDYRKLARAGGDPLALRRRPDIPTFAEAVESVIAIHKPTWRNARSAEIWRASIRDYALPRLGRKRVDQITTADVMACLIPHWQTRTETMRRVRQRLSAIFKWAIAEGHRNDNPSGEAISAALPKSNGSKKNMRALPHAEVGTAIQKIKQSGAYPGTKLAFEFLVLTACRSGEVRGAKWSEIDLEKAMWTIPGERMKTGKEHRVPLSRHALEVLAEAREFSDGSELIFPSVTGKVLSDSTISKLVRENGIPAVPHGFRSSFRDWCAESGVAREVAEACLAHVVGGVEGSYFRSDVFQLRREVMEAWGVYISGGTYE